MKSKEKDPFCDLEAIFEGQAWLAAELAEKLNLPVETVRRRMIILENVGRIMHVKEGRFNWYFTVKDFRKYLAKHPEERIKWSLNK